MAIDTKKCPYCFRTVNDPEDPNSSPSTWSDDPILIDNGTKYDMVNKGGGEWRKEETDGRKYVGFTQIKGKHIKELQDVRKAQEITFIPEWEIENRTEFTEVPTDDYFIPHKNYIKELRESTEKIVARFTVDDPPKFGTFAGYFNYMGRYWQGTRKLEWTDPDLDIYNDNLKNIHIEELRHSIEASSIPITFLMEKTATTIDSGTFTYWDFYTYDNIVILGVPPYYNPLYDEEDGYWYWTVSNANRTYHEWRRRYTVSDTATWDIRASDRTLHENECTLSLGTEEPEASDTLLYYKKADEENKASFGDVTSGKTDYLNALVKHDYYRSATEPTHRFDGELYDSTGWYDPEDEWNIDYTWSIVSDDSYVETYGYRWGIAHLP